MSTRSIIVVTGHGRHIGHETVRLYKHSDGYPSGNLPIIADALKASNKVVKEHNQRFKGHEERPLVTELVVGKIIGEASTEYGMGAQIDSKWDGDKEDGLAVYSEALCMDHLGNQGDLEWVYVVDLERKSVDVYAGCPDDIVLGKTTDLIEYVDMEKEKKEIMALVKAVESTGFKVNKKAAVTSIAAKKPRGRPRKHPVVNLVNKMK